MTISSRSTRSYSSKSMQKMSDKYCLGFYFWCKSLSNHDSFALFGSSPHYRVNLVWSVSKQPCPHATRNAIRHPANWLAQANHHEGRCGVSVLLMKWKWPKIMLDPIKMFEHSRFKSTMNKSHPKVIALVKTMDTLWGCNKFCTSTMTIKLPPQEDYQFTPAAISGHQLMIVAVFPPPGPSGSIDALATIFLFDLMGKTSEDGKRFSTKASFEENIKLD